MSKLVPVARYNPTLFVDTAQISHMKIVETENRARLDIFLKDGTYLIERFESSSQAAEAAVRICNAVNQV